MNLKNSLIGLLLMAVSAGAMAEWTKIGAAADGKFDSYVDLSTIRKSGNVVKIWNLRDYKKTQIDAGGKSYLSWMTRMEYDCNEENFRQLSIYQYSGNMKNGDIVWSGDVVDKWNSIPPESIGEVAFKIVCGAK